MFQNLGNFSDYERYLTWKVFFYSFTANNMRLLLMTLAPKIVLPFPIPRISLPGENYFEMEFCEEGKCLTTIGIQLGFFLVFKPLTSLLAYSKDDMWRGFKNKIRTLYVTLTCSSRSSSYSRTRRESIHPALIGRIDKEYRLYESDRRVLLFMRLLLFRICMFRASPLPKNIVNSSKASLHSLNH